MEKTNTAKELVKKIIFKYTKFGAPYYPYMIEPIQIANIINALEELRKVEGNICEIGVARGMTSRLICEHLVLSRYQTKFFCIDTFNSFTDEDVDYEVRRRGKKKSDFKLFRYNDFEIWSRNFSKFPFVEPIKCDVNKFDFGSIAPIKFVFLDVDLYLPIKTALNNMPPYIVKGGIVMVDNVLDNSIWDGAFEAFMEFVETTGKEYKIVGNRCGLIRF